MSALHRGDQLAALIRSLQGLKDHADRHPLDYVKFTRAQVRYLRSKSHRKLLRIGNRGGKSFVALADVYWRAMKNHPYRPDWNARRGPQHQWIVSVSWSQLVPLMRIFRSFIAEGTVVKAPSWDEAKGWGKDAPTLVFANGSTVGWRTLRQGPLALSGAELDHVLKDEPGTVEEYRELERRTISRGGEYSQVMTPVNAPGDLGWLRDMATDGIFEDLNFPMNEELFTFEDGSLRTLPDGTLCNAAWIAEQIKAVPLQYREIVINGGWDEIVTDGAFSETFSRSKHVHTFDLDGREVFSLGVDHGSQAFTETAVLVAVDESTEYPSVYVLDCYEANKDSPAEQDARNILKMISNQRVKGKPLAWSSLKRATGDIAHYGGRGRINKKSNIELSYEIARELKLGKNQALVPPLWTAKTGAGSNPRGSTYRGVSWLHKALLRDGQITIHPRCTSLIEAMEKFRGGSTDPHGHLVDALRYSLDYWINRGQTRNVAPANVRF